MVENKRPVALLWPLGRLARSVTAVPRHEGRLVRGTDSPTQADGLNIRDLLNHFLTSKTRLRDTGSLTSRSFDDYYATCERIKAFFGLNRAAVDVSPTDFEAFRAEIAKTRGLVAIGNRIQRIRMVFKFAFDAGLIAQPIRFGPNFRRPSKKALRQVRNARRESPVRKPLKRGH